MANFARYVLGDFLIFQENPGHHPYQIEDVLPKEAIRELAFKYPPSQDPEAAQYLRTLLGDGVIPKPLKMGE
jgi:hypothetical protein